MPQNEKDGVLFNEPKTSEERTHVAGICTKGLSLTLPTVIGGLDNRVEQAYAAWPERLYVVGKDGRIVFKGGPGPRQYRPAELAEFLADYLSQPGNRKGVEAVQSTAEPETPKNPIRAEEKTDWAKAIAEAVEASKNAKTLREILAAATLFDIAANAAMGFEGQDRAFYLQCRREVNAGCEELLGKILGNEKRERALSVLLDLPELPMFLVPEPEGLKAELKDGQLFVESPPARAGTSPGSYWVVAPDDGPDINDYILDMEFQIERGGFTLFHRDDALRHASFRFPMSPKEPQFLGLTPLQEGKTYRVIQRIWCNSISDQRAEKGQPLPNPTRSEIGLHLRYGGVAIAFEPESRITFSRFQLRSLR